LSAPLLRVEQLVTGYGELRVVRGVSFALGADEILAVIGANGVGKTTMLNAIVGQLRIWSGTVELDGKRVAGRASHKIVSSGIALVPEGRRVFASLSVEENLLLGAHSRPGRREVAADVAHWFESFPALRELRRRPAGLLSGGEQQMLALARALMSRPKVLLLDEPSLGLAPKVIQSVFEFIARVRAEGTAIVLVEQNARLALERADRGIVMQRGEVVMEGSAASLSADPRVRDIYLGRVDAASAAGRDAVRHSSHRGPTSPP
jgi:branched-chain amino acid transport system ATP-binding protein